QAAARSTTYREFVAALYGEYASLRGKPFSGEKTPDYVRRLRLLHALFPWAKVVHIVRDGRDVCLSTLEWAREDKGPGKFDLWDEEPVAVCALWWSWQVSPGMREGTALGPSHYHELRYEELVAKPEETLRSLAAFLELPFAPQMLSYHEGKTRSDPGLSAKKAWLPPTPGLRDWRTQMTERDQELFEALAGDLLADLGYERGRRETSNAIASTAELCRQWWDCEMSRRQAKLASAMDSSMDRE
ncbi:MAG: sulfotransferase, partial [Planctomycetes bacterium]|nr:sulfotransferase [Planctomycetota bacterium]